MSISPPPRTPRPAPRRRRRVVTAAVTAVAGAVLSSAAAYAAAPPAGPVSSFGGNAYGSAVNLAGITSSPTAQAAMCTQAPGVTATNSDAALTVPGVGTIGAVTTETDSNLLPGRRRQSTSTATAAATSLLAGAVTFTGATSHAALTSTGSGFLKAASSEFTNLRVAGVPVPVSGNPNQTVAIPLIGSATINAQSFFTDSNGAHSLRVSALRITVGHNLAGLPTGTIVIGVSTATLRAAATHRAFGSAYGASVVAGSAIKTRPTATAAIPCGGSNGVTSTRNLAGTSVPQVLTTGATTATATSTDSPSATTATTTSDVADVSLLGGLVQAGGIASRAQATRTSAGLSTDGSGSTFTDLVVNGVPQSGDVAPNTAMDVPGVGTVYLNRVMPQGGGVMTTAISIVLSDPTGTLPAGSVIKLGVASAGVTDH